MSKRCLTCGMYSNENEVLRIKNQKLEAELEALRKLTLKLWLNSGGSRQSFDHAMKGGET